MKGLQSGHRECPRRSLDRPFALFNGGTVGLAVAEPFPRTTVVREAYEIPSPDHLERSQQLRRAGFGDGEQSLSNA